MSVNKPLVIYDHRVRWVAVLNMAFVVAGICLALRSGSGVTLYLPVAFLALFSLFWIRDLLFGFRLKLVSDGCTLHWQDGKSVGSVFLSSHQSERKEMTLPANKSVESNRRPAFPLNAERQLGSVFWAPPLVSAPVAYLWRSAACPSYAEFEAQ
jgi:hypothetical protein